MLPATGKTCLLRVQEFRRSQHFSVHQHIHPPFHLPPSIYPATCLPIYLFIYPSPTYPSIISPSSSLAIYQCIYLSILLFILHPFTNPSIHPFAYSPSIYPETCIPIHQSILSYFSSLHPSPHIHLAIYQPMHSLNHPCQTRDCSADQDRKSWESHENEQTPDSVPMLTTPISPQLPLGFPSMETLRTGEVGKDL